MVYYKYHLQIPNPFLNKIASIKVIRFTTNASLKEALELINNGPVDIEGTISGVSPDMFDNISSLIKLTNNTETSLYKFWFSFEGNMGV